MDERLKKYKKLKSEVEKAIEWNNLPNGKKYMGIGMEISLAHCTAPKLKRMGQKYQGSDSYWDTSDVMDNAILEYIVKDWNKHWPEVLKILQYKRDETLKDLRSFVDAINSEINKLETSSKV